MLQTPNPTVADSPLRTHSPVALPPLSRQAAAEPPGASQWLARELHDGVLQDLLFLGLELSSLRDEIPSGERDLSERVTRLATVAKDDVGKLRSLLGQIRSEPQPCVSLQHELIKHIERFRARARATVRLKFRGLRRPMRVSGELAHHIASIVDEALCNARKHGSAEEITAVVRKMRNGLVVSVTDDGCGFDPSRARSGHFGLQIMRERAEAIGAKLEVSSAPGHGTTVSLYLAEM